MKIINTGKQSAKKIMEIDERLLSELEPSSSPILHLYEFYQPAATHGYFIKPTKNFDKVNYAKRPTGGGWTFHIWDLAFSVLIPKEHEGYHEDVMENYKYINSMVLQSMGDLCQLLPVEPIAQDPLSKDFCFGKPTKYDVMIGEKKLAGAAQRRKRNGYLHQGSISIVMPDFEFLGQFLPEEVIYSMKRYTYAPFENLEEGRKEVSHRLQQSFKKI